MDAETIQIKVEILGLKLMLATLVRALPEDQKARVIHALVGLGTAADVHNADFDPLTIGEEGTHQLNLFMRHMQSLISGDDAKLWPEYQSSAAGFGK